MPRSGLNVSLERVDLDGPRHGGSGREGAGHDLPRRSGAPHAGDRRVDNDRDWVPFDHASRDRSWRDGGGRYDTPHDRVQRDRARPQNPLRTNKPATANNPAAPGRPAVLPTHSSPSPPRSPSSPRASTPLRAPRSAQPARATAPDSARDAGGRRPYDQVAPPRHDRPARSNGGRTGQKGNHVPASRTEARTNRRATDTPASPTTAGTDPRASDLPARTRPGATSRPQWIPQPAAR